MCKRAIIVANGIIRDDDWARAYIEPDDYVIAADGGSQFLSRYQIQPQLIIGDQDSSTSDQIDSFSRGGAEIIQAPVNKNESDLELAISFVVQRKFPLVRILGGFGGRIDHQLGNFAILSRDDLAALDVRFVDKALEVFLIRPPQGLIEGRKGELVSLIPWGTDASGITTSNLVYSLHDEPLLAHQTRGLSNLLASHSAKVWLRSGKLLCVHETHDE